MGETHWKKGCCCWPPWLWNCKCRRIYVSIRELLELLSPMDLYLRSVVLHAGGELMRRGSRGRRVLIVALLLSGVVHLLRRDSRR